MNRNVRPKCGLASREMKPFLQFHVINMILPNLQLRQCQETCPSTKALADLLCDLTVLLLGKPLLSETCYGRRGKDGKGLEVRCEVVFPGAYWLGILGCTDCCHVSWIYSTGETVSASISILHITYTLHSYIYLNILTQ